MTEDWKKTQFITQTYCLKYGSDHDHFTISADAVLHNGKLSELIIRDWDLSLSSFQFESLLKLFEQLKKEGKIADV